MGRGAAGAALRPQHDARRSERGRMSSSPPPTHPLFEHFTGSMHMRFGTQATVRSAMINAIPCMIDLVGSTDLDAMIASTILAAAAIPAAQIPVKDCVIGALQ